ncbi:glutamate-cysteine ligase family protein [Streptomyces sp. NPDC003393]
MPADLLEDEAEAHVRGVCFKNGPPERTGVELEWLVHDRFATEAVVPVDRLDEALAPVVAPGTLPAGSFVTREPGGQIEISSPPATTVAACVETTATDLAVLRNAVESAGMTLTGRGLDPHREPPRVLDHPRYRAMEQYFDREGPWGRVMMRRTASIQVNSDCGDAGTGTSGHRYRWDLAHRLGPVLVAAFANSPLASGRPTGCASTRQAIWARTLAVAITNGAADVLARSLALELALIRVNAISPGVIDTGAWDVLGEQGKAEHFADAGDRSPARRIGTSRDVANAALFATTSTFVTGVILPVDGGEPLT